MTISAFRSECDAASSDWLRDLRVSWLWPSAFVLAGVGWLLVPGATGPVLAAAGFAIAGSLCVANALQCRRVHCAVTGPLYLVAALMFVAKAGGGSIPGGWIVAGAGMGTAVAFVLEWLGKLYFDARPETTRGRVAAAGTFVAAGLVAACCLGPTLFVVFGLSIASLGALGALEPYRWLFLVAGLTSWAVAYRERRRAMAACAAEACGTPARRRISGILLWASLTALLVAAAYPYKEITMRLIAAVLVFLFGGSPAFAADAQRTLALSGPTCAACSAAVTKAFKGVDGVRGVTVSEDRTRALVVADEAVPEDKLVAAITRLGYGARAATPE